MTTTARTITLSSWLGIHGQADDPRRRGPEKYAPTPMHASGCEPCRTYAARLARVRPVGAEHQTTITTPRA